MKASWCQKRCLWKEASGFFISCGIRSICRRINQLTGRVWWCFEHFCVCLHLHFIRSHANEYVFAVQRDRFIWSQDKALNSGRTETRVCSSKQGKVCWTRINSGNLNAEWKKRVKSEYLATQFCETRIREINIVSYSKVFRISRNCPHLYICTSN